MLDKLSSSAHPSYALQMAILNIIRSTPQKEEGERLMDALMAYFREPIDSKITKAENKTSAANYTIECKNKEIKELILRNESQSKLLKESGIKTEMNNLYHKLCEISFITK